MILRRGGDRIEADIDDVIVQIGRHREGYAFLDMGEGRIFGRRRHGHRNANELGDDRLGVSGGFLDHGDAQRHVDLSGAAGRSDDDAAFDADLHHHVAADQRAFARGAHERALISHRHRPIVGAVGVAGAAAGSADGQRGSARPDIDQRAIDVLRCAGDRLLRRCR